MPSKRYTQTPEGPRALCGTVLQPGQRVVVVSVNGHWDTRWSQPITRSKQRYTIEEVSDSSVKFTRRKTWHRRPKELIVVGHPDFHTTPNGEECDCVGW